MEVPHCSGCGHVSHDASRSCPILECECNIAKVCNCGMVVTHPTLVEKRYGWQQ